MVSINRLQNLFEVLLGLNGREFREGHIAPLIELLFVEKLYHLLQVFELLSFDFLEFLHFFFVVDRYLTLEEAYYLFFGRHIFILAAAPKQISEEASAK